jgi:CBS domain-containing protein/anti-sigma regulatory factor (Ser/Thr protein kinase)
LWKGNVVEQKPAELTRVQELVYELKIEQIMSRNVITVTPDCSIAELKEILRVKRISGVPVVERGALVGVISIDNVIRALEKGEMAARVGQKMTVHPLMVRAEESVVSAVQLFARYGYGRFPVVDGQGRLVGIITHGDVVRGLLKQMEVQWHAGEAQRQRASHIFEGIESDQTILTLHYSIKKHDFAHGGESSSKIKRALERLGGVPGIVRRVAVATYEAEMNVMIHSDGGEIIAQVQPEVIQVTTLDRGPGIPDIEQALRPGYSTAPDWIRDLGFGAGMGLANIKACTDEMKLTSEMGVSTRLEMTFKL